MTAAEARIVRHFADREIGHGESFHPLRRIEFGLDHPEPVECTLELVDRQHDAGKRF